ncbi:MAG: OmpH family outer membrane protein [Candidatus Melainabacteria bacterium]|nr:OmpH family outer membrane protein [Candidatus Melainabacteria bacterium]
MLSTRKSITLVSALAIAAGGAGFMNANAQAPDAKAKLGIVDTRVVYEKFPKIKELQDQAQKEEERIHKLIERGNKEYQAAQKANKPKAELSALQKRLQGEINKELENYQKKFLAEQKEILDQFDNAVKAEAKNKNLETVLDKSTVLMGGLDITEGVVSRLAAATKPAASAKPTTTK